MLYEKHTELHPYSSPNGMEAVAFSVGLRAFSSVGEA